MHFDIHQDINHINTCTLLNPLFYTNGIFVEEPQLKHDKNFGNILQMDCFDHCEVSLTLQCLAPNPNLSPFDYNAYAAWLEVYQWDNMHSCKLCRKSTHTSLASKMNKKYLLRHFAHTCIQNMVLKIWCRPNIEGWQSSNKNNISNVNVHKQLKESVTNAWAVAESGLDTPQEPP